MAVWFDPILTSRIVTLSLLSLVVTLPAQAHPHIFVDAEVDIRFDDAGRVAGLSHRWTFDTAASVWMVQGLDVNGDGVLTREELQPLADENVAGLADYGFYTFAGESMEFTTAGDQRMRYENNRVTLDFSINAVEPQAPGHRFELGVYDAEYYVAITVEEPADVRLINPPGACAVELLPPREMDAATEERLYALGPEVLELPPDLAAAMRGTQGLIVVSCDGERPVASTAVEAAEQVAHARPAAAPFGGLPAEPGLSLPRTGFFGWLQDQQRDFYAALTAALDAMRRDGTAFWTLGGLSFLYGVFHAAGPGHGKVVISSYMLANERQLRQGVALSALSALLQSLVAIAFVLVLAGMLQMTSMAMSDAAHWVGLISYALVALLGLWLVLRKVFGWGHHHHAADHHNHDDHGHAHDHHDHNDHRHHDDEGHGEHMHHAIAPADLDGGWREQLSVVLAVGLRPCSGALVVMVFALSQGLLAAGVVSVLLMGLGTAITVAALASIAVGAKGLAVRLGGASGKRGATITWWAELVGALLVLLFGLALLVANL